MAKNLEVSFLLDFYGEMLTQKQHDFLVYYYDEDLSLSEIAENEGITRQGVRADKAKNTICLQNRYKSLTTCRLIHYNSRSPKNGGTVHESIA